jgi:regulator of protease activity HflC (stomatin/prohibitin superfamily)
MHDISGFLFFLIFVFGFVAAILLRAARPRRIFIFEYQRGALFIQGALKQVLGPGRYWSTRSRQITLLDTRLQTLNVAGQEVLTTDGLSLKITLAGEYRIIDPARYLLTSTLPATSLYQDSQQALREAAADLSFESVLATRTTLNARLLELIIPQAQRLGLEITSLQIRDIILPGELKRAYAQAVTAQKEGLAALERARAESAALRSLANAARLMQDNPGLLQLRALQAVESSKGNTLTLKLSSIPDNISSDKSSAP